MLLSSFCFDSIIVPIVEKYKNEAKFSITTNGILLDEDKVNKFIDNLPFKLTGDQSDSVKDIFDQNQEMQDSVKDEFQNQNEIIAQESQSLSDRLLNGLQSLFTPSEGFVDKKVDDLRKNYAFANSIAMTAKDLETFLTSLGSVPPVIRINLGSATTSYNLGGDMVFIDFSFYEPYKASMDAVLSAFLWLWFCWRVILNLPGIIGGVSGFIGAFTDSRHVGSDPVPASSWQMPFGSSHGVVSLENRAPGSPAGRTAA